MAMPTATATATATAAPLSHSRFTRLSGRAAQNRGWLIGGLWVPIFALTMR